jgi:photosystem II stability/assembly factor-like uncharacterized protein
MSQSREIGTRPEMPATQRLHASTGWREHIRDNAPRRVSRTRMGALLATLLLLAPPLQATAQMPTGLLAGLRWRMIGPFEGGRVEAVSGVAGDPSTFYFGAVDGGIWKTTDGGDSWRSVWNEQGSASVGAIAVAPSDPNVIYAGTGEADPRTDISFGDGVYRSTDAGRTWTNLGLNDSRHIGRIVVDPRDPDLVYVAALGHVYDSNTERGVFRSSDGGRTWQKVLYVDAHTGAIDLAMSPRNPRVLFAGMWQVYRTPWSLVSGGPGSGLYRSTDGGTTWRKLEGNGLPAAPWGRVSVSVGADGDHVYALINAAKGGLYRSDDGGDHWRLINDDQNIRQRPWYYFRVQADPQDPSTVYFLNFFVYRSTDGGASITRLSPPHVDNHAMWIDPTDPDRMIEGNDGGASITGNGGRTWSSESNQPTAQLYHVATDNRFPYRVYGAQQDRGTYAILSRTDHGAITDQDWYDVAGGESGYVLPDPTDPEIVYAGSYFGDLTRFDHRTGQVQDITPWPENTEGYGADSAKYRFSWTSPLALDPHDPHALYSGSQVLLKTTDGGQSWTEISPDLTRNDKSKQGVSGGPVTLDNVGAEYYDVIYTIAPSAAAQGEIWVGTDDGLIQLTRDGGKTWHNVTPKALPAWASVDLIDAPAGDAATAYAAVDAHMSGDFAPYIFRTHDYGKTWTSAITGLPPSSYVHFVRSDPERKGLLYAGTETGVYVSFDDGDHWQPLQLNLPTTSMRDLVVHDNDLILATHGRGFWILDDVDALRQATPAVADSAAYLFAPEPAIRTPAGGGFGENAAAGTNAPAGAIIDYYLKSAPPNGVRLDILDSGGRVIASFGGRTPELGEERRAPPAAPGLDRFVWDLRYTPPPPLRVAGGPVFEQGRPMAPSVVPGDYQVRLTVDGRSQTRPLTVKLDPRLKVSPQDLAQQLDLMTKLNQALVQDHVAFNQIASLREQLRGLQTRLGDDASTRPVATAAADLDAKADSLAVAFFQYHARAPKELMMNYPTKLNARLANLEFAVGSADAAPTAQELAVYQKYRQALDARLAEWNAMRNQDMAHINALMQQHGIPPIYVPASGASGATSQR